MENKIMHFMPTGLVVRESQNGEESRIIEGKAICFNEETTLFDGAYERVREVIAPSCISAEWLATQDVKLNLLHNREDSIARNNKGEGTLQFELKEDGLYFKAEMPKCDIGERALQLVKNKTYTGCSFEALSAAHNEDVTQLEDGREDVLITHTKFTALTALTIALDPQYEGTSVMAREKWMKREEELKAMSEDCNTSKEEPKVNLEREKAVLQMHLRNQMRKMTK